MKWRWLIWLVLLLGSTSAQTLSSTQLEAKRYLHACINAVAVAAINSGMTSAFDGQSCSNPAFDIAQFFDGKFSTPAVEASRIKFGSAGLEDFKIEVTDRGGKTWTGSLDNYPKIAPRKSPLTPQQLAQAQASAYQTAAQNVARMCVSAVEVYRVNHLERLQPKWDGKSCQEARLISAASGAAIERSLVTLRPETVEGYQVTVWPKTGAAVVMPAQLTPKPPDLHKEPPILPTLPQPLGFILGCIFALLVGGLTLLLTTFKLPSSRTIGGLGIGLGMLLLAIALLIPPNCCPTTNDSWVPGIFRALGELARLLLSGAPLLIPPRLACWWEREPWWVSVGSAVLVGVFVVLGTGGSLSVEGLSDGLQDTFQYALPVLSAALVIWVLWQRLRNGK